MKLKQPKFNSITFGYILWASLGIMVLFVGAGIYWGANLLGDQARKTDHAKIDADLSSEDVANLKRLEAELENQKDIVARAEQIVADSQQYRYQDQIVYDINSFASDTSVEILGYNFGTQEQAGRSSRKAGPIVSVPGVTALTADVTLRSPIQYTDFMRFLKATEQNLTKMQVTGVNMTPNLGNPNLVSNPTIGLIIYVRDE